MNVLTKRVCEILDFPLLHRKIAFMEALDKGKLLGTIMIVNGKVVEVHKMNFDKNTIINGITGETHIVETLDVFLPKCGIYTNISSNRVYLLTKNTGKHWEKSFKSKNYSIYSAAKNNNKVNFMLNNSVSPEELYNHQHDVCYWYLLNKKTQKLYDVMYLTTKVASIDTEKKIIFLKNHIVTKEDIEKVFPFKKDEEWKIVKV